MQTAEAPLIDRDLALELAQFAAVAGDAGLDTVSRLIAQVRARGEDALATDLDEVVATATSREVPIGLYPLRPKKSLQQLNLPAEVTEAIADFLREQRSVQALADANLDPRHKALFIGPPGNGKTVLAGAISMELGIRSFMVRYDDLISNRPGETSRNLNRIFNYAKQEPTLLFFDEFDALGRERDDAQETGEMKRVTSTLLVQIDDLPPHVVAIAATNHGQMLDAAIWRRFNIRIELPRPRLDQFEAFMREMFQQYGHDPRDDDDITLELVGYRMIPENFSDAELFVRNCARLFVISKNEGAPLTIERCIKVELVKWSSGQKKVVT